MAEPLKTAGVKLPALKVTISGNFRNSKKEYIDFEGVEGFIPRVEEEFATAAIRKRYALMWIMADKRFPERPHSLREVFIDEMTETEHEFTFVDKDIKQMSYEELQDLAVCKGLRNIPLYKKSSIRGTREVAYVEFANRCLGLGINKKDPDFDYNALPALTVDAVVEKNIKRPMTPEESLEVLAAPVSVKDDGTKIKLPSREQLVRMAKDRDVKFHPSITDEKLYDKLFS